MRNEITDRAKRWFLILLHKNWCFSAPLRRRCSGVIGALTLCLGVVGDVFGANQGFYPNWATLWPAKELYDSDCGPLYNRGQYGPFDYRLASPDDRWLVEGAHFDLEYQAYLKGKKVSPRAANTAPPAAGFSYTLWAFPNHVQSLAAMEDLGRRHKTDRPPGAKNRVHCYFQRAVRFVPDDAEVRAIYGYYYARRGKFTDAMTQLEKAETLDVQKATLWVYIAFAYIEMKNYEKSLSAAKKAYLLGYPLPGLRNRLVKAGVWID